jgi:UDP-N-acetylmuramate dehydrogenase
MMAALRPTGSLIERLPRVRGRYTANAPLAGITWFKVGGPAEVMFRPADVEDLAVFLAARPADLPVTVIGVGSNLLVRDGGVRGVVIRLGRGFVEMAAVGDVVTTGAGALDFNVSLLARESGLAGLEFLSGIPGTIGGGLRMNAGAYQSEMKDVLIDAEAVDGNGKRHKVGAAELNLTYRHCGAPEDWIFVGARLRGKPGDRDAIQRRMDEIATARAETQPIRTPTGGSTFANPTGRKAWQLIEAAGCRGLVRGGAMVSEKHCNFLINTGSASASDIEGLGEEVRRRVLENSGVTLDWEIRRIGEVAS